jgi:prepilin-type N-terminal cleavage/methylation domain-containing protein
MISHKNKTNGFTIVELVIVIVVIGILTAIILSTHNGIEVKARNNTRQSDIGYIQTQLESYDSQNGHYPSLADLNNASWRDKNMKGFNVGDMIDPSSGASSVTALFAATPAAKIYSYQVTDSNGNTCEKDDTNCAQYTLTATYEGTVNGAHTFVKKNED